jgi:MFS family permease
MSDDSPLARADPAHALKDPASDATRPAARRDFWMLWLGQSVSLFGDQFMLIALPLMAVIVLDIPVAQAALLPFAFKLPFLVIGLPAGAILDRVRRRPTLILAQFVQFATCFIIAILAVVGSLSFWMLMALTMINGTFTVFFQIAYTSFVPVLFSDTSSLQRANARLELSESVSRSAGPMSVGPLIAVTGPVGAIFANSGSFLMSMATLLAIRQPEPAPSVPPRERGWLVRDVREGLRFVVRHPLLEPIMSCGTVYVTFQSIIMTILVLYCAEVLHLGYVAIGLVVGAAALGYPIGNLASSRVADKIGSVRTVVLGATLSVTGFIIMPIAGSAGSAIGLVAGSIVHGIGEGTFGPTWLTLRQTETPERLLGRANSVERFLLWGAVPLGSLLSSVLISLVGLPATFWIGALGTALCLPPLVRRGVLSAVRPSKTPAD